MKKRTLILIELARAARAVEDTRAALVAAYVLLEGRTGPEASAAFAAIRDALDAAHEAELEAAVEAAVDRAGALR